MVRNGPDQPLSDMGAEIRFDTCAACLIRRRIDKITLADAIRDRWEVVICGEFLIFEIYCLDFLALHRYLRRWGNRTDRISCVSART